MRSYLNLLRDVLDNGESHDDRTGVGTLSVFGRQWRHDMRNGFPLLTTKKVPLRWVFEELKWFLSGSTNVADLQANNVTIWDEWATKEQCAKFGRPPGELGPIYGHLWRNFGGWNIKNDYNVPGLGVDQIAVLLDDLVNSPNSRRLIVTGWNPETCKLVALPPCHTLWQLKVHCDSSLSLELRARSIDIYLGLPFNIASYALLLEMLCFVTCRTARELIISFGDLHLYNNHIEQALLQLTRDPYPLAEVRIGVEEKESKLETLLSINWQDVVHDYKSHPKIEAPVAV